MFLGSCLLLPLIPGRTDQRPSVPPDSGSLFLWNVDFPCPLAHGHLPRAERVGFPRPPRCGRLLQARHIGFPCRRLLLPWPLGHLPELPRPYHAACVSLLPTPGHLYLSLTASSWPRIPRGWQARLPRWVPVISRISKRLSPACSSTPILLPQECCERRSFLPACTPAGLQRGTPYSSMVPPTVAAWCLFTLVCPTQAVGRPGR
jgi:hypothetical protein